MRNVLREQYPVEAPSPDQGLPIADAQPEAVRPAASAPATRRTRRARRETAYDRITRVLGLAMAAVLLLGLWLTGGYFTLLWLTTLGFAPAGPGIAIGNWILQRGPVVTDHWLRCFVFDWRNLDHLIGSR
jgi:hypothetical protein